MIRLEGAVACVTGGARGIGRATAVALAARGARVWIGDIDLPAAEATAAEIGGHAAYLDVTDPSGFAEFLIAAGASGPVEILVNNAGIMRLAPFLDLDLAGHHREMAINVGGVINGMSLALPGMVARGRGHIVNVASMAAKVTTPGAAVYCASKFAVGALSRAVRAELADTGVSVTTVMPAAVHTELTSGVNLRLQPTLQPEEVGAAIVDTVRHRRAEVTIPRWLAPMGTVEQGVPETALRAVKRRFVGREPGQYDQRQRSAYLDRIRH
ncbi:SDR family oxidoreductase [Nocardia takedensis]|uniref:SDR family oxidoreductase n=1 Tax=Nocardia takedensis TaxID=259390 RepID=UPI0002D48825|nr:SDR family oxidoreductase [Nocardia takedensis]